MEQEQRSTYVDINNEPVFFCVAALVISGHIDEEKSSRKERTMTKTSIIGTCRVLVKV
jgi:hypothetical protein